MTPRTSPCAARPVLNAFRHHRGGHTSTTVTLPTGSMCSTPFGITEVGIHGGRGAISRPRLVLNAFRHHRGGHNASTEMAPAGTVLNAFRHHRGGHQEVPFPRSASAKVLNAFRHHRGGHTLPPAPIKTCWPCAQRLSASQRWASHGASRTGLGSNVLNAFRHHRGGHGSSPLCSAPRVGAQRLSASQRWASPPACTSGTFAPMCSTPFGITEVGISATNSTCARSAVLNAFRHHRGGHIVVPSTA